MRLKKLGAALFVVAALGAVIASSAFAAATTTDVKWYTGSGTGTELSGAQAISSKIAKNSEEKERATFVTHASEHLYELESTGISCLNCTIENSGGTAIGHGELVFEGVKVLQPAGCSVASTITTKPLTVKADYMISSTNYIEFEPTAGASTQFATVAITGCTLATNLVPKGTVFVQSANPTGTGAVEQEVKSSGAIETAAGGTLAVGLEKATLTGNAKFKMTGSHVGEAFQTH